MLMMSATYRGLCAALCASALLATAVPANAGLFAVKDFEKLVSEAEMIFLGTVSGEAAQKLAGGTIVTDVTFASAQVLKGPPEATVVLRVVGGAVGRESLELTDVPRFRPGVRYLVFVKGNGRTIFPVVGGRRGLFQVVRDPALQADVVRDAGGRPLAETPVPLAAFLAAVEEELRLR
jgi:hypothetical protein